MKIEIEIITDNDSWQTDKACEIEYILHSLRSHLINGSQRSRLTDTNGNLLSIIVTRNLHTGG